MEEQYEEDDDLSLHDAIMLTHQIREAEATTGSNTVSGTMTNKRKPIKPDSYFSDEDASD